MKVEMQIKPNLTPLKKIPILHSCINNPTSYFAQEADQLLF